MLLSLDSGSAALYKCVCYILPFNIYTRYKVNSNQYYFSIYTFMYLIHLGTYLCTVHSFTYQRYCIAAVLSSNLSTPVYLNILYSSQPLAFGDGL